MHMSLKIDADTARQAMRYVEFREFLKTEIKIKNDDDIKKLGGCGDCWNKAGFTQRTVKKINDELERMKDENKINLNVQVHSKWFPDKASLIKFIQEQDETGILEYFAGFKK